MILETVAPLFVPPLLPVDFAISWQGEKAQWGFLAYSRGEVV